MVEGITVEYLRKNDVLALVLDYDGVLVAHGDLELTQSVARWLDNLCAEYAGKICILSNKPTSLRKEYIQRCFPRVEFVVARRKKPYPDGLLQILADVPQLLPEQVLLVDDRLGTGMLAVELAGVRGLLVFDARRNFRRRPLVEGWFALLRCLERFVARYCCI